MSVRKRLRAPRRVESDQDSESTRDDFTHMHALLRQKKYSDVMHEIRPTKSRKIAFPYSKDRNHAWYLLGDCFSKLERFNEAATAFGHALRSWPLDGQAMFAIAYCYSEAKKPDLSIRYLTKLIEHHGPKDAYLYNLANAYFDCDDFDAALEIYRRLSKQSKGEIRRMSIKNMRACVVRIYDAATQIRS
jgi:tetratricopeptide (TPR) repeat protein